MTDRLHVWHPDEPVRHGGLSKPELRWLAGKAQETPSKSPADARRLHQLASKLQEHVGLACAGIGNATVAFPPPKRSTLGQRRGSDPSDPALSQIESTHHVIDAALTRLGHLFADCPACDNLNPGAGHNDSVPTVLDLTGLEVVTVEGWPPRVGMVELADHCTGLSATSPNAVTAVLAQAPQVATQQANVVVDLWHQARNDGAESDVLRDQIGQLSVVVSRARRVRDLVGQWLPSLERRCKICNESAVPLPDDATPRGGRTCDRCAKRQSRASA